MCGSGAVRFAISEDRVNFYDFARLFRDHLKCPNALFLDGGRGVGISNPDNGPQQYILAWRLRACVRACGITVVRRWAAITGRTSLMAQLLREGLQ